MEMTGRIIAVLPERSGTSPRTGNPWRAASYVLETSEQYPKKLCFDVFGDDRIQMMNIQAGETLTVKFDIDAHEYNGRWYNSIRAFAVDRNAAPAGPAPVPPADMPPFAGAPAAPAAGASQADPFPSDNDGGDLPF